jgi:abhydrolase domain-containing protein 5
VPTGLSGRPKFTCKNREETEAWFVNSLDKWREAQGLDSMVLVGHSLGGYLSACYALAHPERVTHLVLVCPAGTTTAVSNCLTVCC